MWLILLPSTRNIDRAESTHSASAPLQRLKARGAFIINRGRILAIRKKRSGCEHLLEIQMVHDPLQLLSSIIAPLNGNIW